MEEIPVIKSGVKEAMDAIRADKKRETQAIYLIKQTSVGLYGKFNYHEDTSGEGDYITSGSEIMKEYNLSQNASIEELYNAIANSGNTITMYEILEWFNEQYNCIKKEAEKLPKLEFMLEKWETGSTDKASFVFERIVGTSLEDLTLSFYNENETINEYIPRRLSFKDNLNAYLECAGRDRFGTQKIDAISKELVKEYLELSKKYINYLNAFSFLRWRALTTICNLRRYYHGVFNSNISGNDPYRNLDNILVGIGHAGNEDAYYFRYNLGNEKLEDPMLGFWDCICSEKPQSQKTIGDLTEDSHTMAKTLRLNRDYLPFKVK